jgi:hypothetical protein
LRNPPTFTLAKKKRIFMSDKNIIPWFHTVDNPDLFVKDAINLVRSLREVASILPEGTRGKALDLSRKAYDAAALVVAGSRGIPLSQAYDSLRPEAFGRDEPQPGSPPIVSRRSPLKPNSVA